MHHHFPTKEDLGRELMVRYRRRFLADLRSIDAQSRSAARRLELFVELFRKTLRDGNRLCLCGMLATEYETLPPSIQSEVRTFYDETEGWLTQVLEAGSDSGEFEFSTSTPVVAKTFLATLEGAMIAARTFGDEARLARAAQWLLSSLRGRAVTTWSVQQRRSGSRTRKVLRGK